MLKCFENHRPKSKWGNFPHYANQRGRHFSWTPCVSTLDVLERCSLLCPSQLYGSLGIRCSDCNPKIYFLGIKPHWTQWASPLSKHGWGWAKGGKCVSHTERFLLHFVGSLHRTASETEIISRLTVFDDEIYKMYCDILCDMNTRIQCVYVICDMNTRIQCVSPHCETELLAS